MKKLVKEIMPIILTLLACFVIVVVSDSIFQGGYLPNRLNRDIQYYEATVLEVIDEELGPDNYTGEFTVGLQNIRVQITEGPYSGEQHVFKNYVSRLYNTVVKKGTDIIVGAYLEDGEIMDLTTNTYKRSHVIVILAIIFFVLVAWIGKLKGVKSIVSLLFTGTCVIFLMLPLMLNGMNPVLAATIIVFLSTFVTLGLVSGINKKTLAAIIGTLSGVLIATLIAYLFGNWSHLSGGTMQDTEALLYVSETSKLQIKGLMLAAILIASLGAVMDVAMSISSSLFELISVNEQLTFKELVRSGMNVGTDMIGTMTNTLILALAGGSLTTMILIFTASISEKQLVNLDVLGTELIQGLSGSIGIVITVPITVVVTAYLCKMKKVD
ncbi:MAG: YibE/F family protein [Turicibacter sanguinis]|uniref:YibE/F family protein n=2 Tax=Turicibacter sanguinis TaxID=154288 RepID=A0A9X4XEN4_9FIRM|nr:MULTISPECIES: YibE/F family protein [Turicibacter]EFF63837.1 YibE/F-like protein [Turicibacter sanguinis PC909]EGC93467.1 YibE/F-like protein [Turicibacter sp. HGF1]MCU7191530.1 YibE/F family protein [Turicibacter sanguinis]MCU7195442.1 YibE/F family protein [Turicibacter sanguinis]MCU7212288.1 YibE/F family protein [Turicibacter sanguinis]